MIKHCVWQKQKLIINIGLLEESLPAGEETAGQQRGSRGNSGAAGAAGAAAAAAAAATTTYKSSA